MSTMDGTVSMPKSFNSMLIDALLDVRLGLSIKKIVSPTIMKSEFRKMLDDTKQKFIEVKDAIDNVFEDYFQKKKTEENNVIEFSEFVGSKKTTFEDGGAEKGTAMVKRNRNHFNTSGEISQEPTNL